MRHSYIKCLAKGRAQCKCNVSLSVLVISCCVTNYHIVGSLKQHPFISSHFNRSEVQHSVSVFSVQSLTRQKLRCWPGCLPIRNLQGRIWLNPAPCGCGTEVPISLLAVSQGPLIAPRGPMHSLPCGPFHLQSQQQRISLMPNLSLFCQEDPCPL